MYTRTSSSAGTWADRLNASKYLAIIQEMFGCFERGDIPGILYYLDEYVDWKHSGNPAILPFAGHFKGHAGVIHYFERLTPALRIEVCTPYNFDTTGSSVSADLHVEGMAIPTGNHFCIKTTLHWIFSPQGQLAGLEQTGDLSDLEQAFLH
ncbi:MAG: hypothetical protein IPM81_19725 [Saprospirales bacterium]|jgi:ketosteroid isomerase-like protein|nr:hypothetical protein [Saprospirales bacterium]